MPALRKSARDRDPRSQHHRSSTTPYASPTGTPSESAHEKKQRSITEWAEPQPQTLAPSFEEHGFARHGVLENMAPLGVPPKARDKQRARNLDGVAPRNSFLAKSSAVLGDEAASTPEVTPAPELEPDDSERQDEEEVPAELPVFQEEDDEDYEPAKAKKKARLSKTPVRGKTPVQKTPVHTTKSPLKNGHSKSMSVSASPAVQAIQVVEPANVTAQRLLIAVNEAVSRANKGNERRVGLAIMRVFEESRSNTLLASSMDAIINQKPTAEHWTTFRSCIKRAKKIEKMKARMQQHDRSDGRAADARGEARSSHRLSPRASSEIVPDDSVSAVHDLQYQQSSSTMAPKLGSTSDSHRALQSAIDQTSSLDPLHPFSTAPTLPAADSSAESTLRMPSKSPRKRPSKNEALAQDTTIDVDGGLSTAAPTPLARTPDTGGSDSELSDVNEEIVQKGPPELPQPNSKSATPVAAGVSKKGKNPANARAAKKLKGSVGKAFGKPTSKQQPPTAEQIAEDERIWALRKELVDQQPIRKLDGIPPPLSDVRFDDEILETESLTESQIAVGPPVHFDQPRSAGRVPQHGTKRLREDTSRVSSPQLESAAATRPSTPAVGPASKRLKLTNGQAAKTKRSPVKNREQGPVAGVPFTSGGGSRQLGPDDNDPNSPQSESDDFCAACRGAGEFVCCENCPRVFHLLCCDPPRTQVPDGAFYCYECNAKLPVSEESAAETYPSLGPLFKSLDRINPRAFALPSEIQTYFEGISARPDGSYFEDVKKFALSKNSGYGYQRPDYTKVIDNDHKVVLCTHCGVSSEHKRQMLKCDFCSAYWHLDCVDPPLANPPHISLEASQRDAWRCPRHIENDFRSGLLLQKDLNEQGHDVEMDDAPPARVPRKLRMRKDPQIIEPTFSRGIQNNGLIDIINDPDDDTDGEGNYVFGTDDAKDLNSKVFRIPEKGLILDFISKVKSGRIAKKKHHAQKVSETAEAQRKQSMNSFLARPIEQQQAALHLTQLAKKDSHDLSEGKVSALLLSLTSEAPPDVITALSNADPPPPSDEERAQLLQLQQLIQRRLGA
ncbi:hypothetical protein LEMA_P009670.1 [Plenodomus lingam JN3]|uniref:PHD-type domain-containing protein n=1 Tax=Leptosphaeria maculans (strain JN3 / isolate v23.1.3 / race Av1-4-5-6-7-8) TaxID=985895 RepID=E5ACH8_LEPMJ|nr:hypothetical protein LEMA_P009670.1 [Plenodomus lingam JN3]CBY02180.1 hypothetical protein LEMA_P009670.1 [Plenodomus lingam JN3]